MISGSVTSKIERYVTFVLRLCEMADDQNLDVTKCYYHPVSPSNYVKHTKPMTHLAYNTLGKMCSVYNNATKK